MTDKKKILFVNDEMRMGGVARVLNTLMASLPKDQYEVDLLVLHKEGMLLGEIPEGVTVYEGTPFFDTVDESLKQLFAAKDTNKIRSKIRLLTYMKTGFIRQKIREERKKILTKQYDVEVAAKEGFCTIFTAYGDSKKKINWVLTDYSVKNYSKNHMRLVKSALKHIDLNIADSKQALIAYQTVFRVQNGIAIHNLMDESIFEKAKQNLKSDIIPSKVPNVLSVARFHPQKGLERLIEASCASYESGRIHNLYLIGGGELEESLRRQVKEHHAKHIYFLGYKKNPYIDMANADLFALSSHYEGFATVINESLMLGTPVLTTRVSGCDEQITSSEHGWITDNNQEAFTEGLKKALKDIELLQDMKQKLKETYRYDNEAILKQFMEVF